MKKFLFALLATTLATPVFAAQQPVAQLSSVTASREALRTAINTQLSAVQSNFDEVYAVIDAGPVYVNTTAPANTKVVWIDTDQDNAIKVYISNAWTVVGSGGEGSYTLPTAAADTLGGVKVGDRLSIADGVLSADIQSTDISGKEDALGNPASSGYVLSSTDAGVRSWVAQTTDTDTDTLGDMTCTEGQIAKMGSSGWECNTDDVASAGTGDDLGNASAGDVVALFSGTGDYLKTDGTKGTPAGDNLGSATYSSVVGLWTTCTGYLKSDGTCDSGGGSMTYPGAGVPLSTGSAWGTSYTVGTAANNLVQLNGSAQLPAVSAAMLTNFPTLNQNTTGTAAGLTAQYIDWSASSGGTSIANKPTLGTAAQYNVGTSANNIPQLNGDGELPYTIPQLTSLQTASGIASGDTSFGTFTGTTITDSSTAKAALQALETAVEGKQGTIAFGTGVETALGVNVGSNGAVALFNGALGTPSFTALNLPSSDADPATTAGQVRHDTIITGLTGGALKYWNGTNARILVDLDTAPTTDDYVIAYDADADKFYMKADSTGAGGTLASEDIDTSAELRTIVTDESGTGALLFAGGDIGAGTATTPSVNDNDTSVATTAYVQSELTAYASDTVTLTNKTYNSAGTGNSLTVPLNGALDGAITDPADADDMIYVKAENAMTLTDIHCLAEGGGSIAITLQECSTSGGSCANIEGAITCDSDGAEDDGTLTDGAIAAGAWIKVLYGAPSGTVNNVAWTVYGTQTW